MINADLSIFLDTGWYQESTIFYKDYIYWIEGTWNENNSLVTVSIYKWAAINEDNEVYHSICNKDNTLVDFELLLEIKGDTIDFAKKQFLEAKIFEGKSFWQVEKFLAWLEEGTPIIKQ